MSGTLTERTQALRTKYNQQPREARTYKAFDASKKSYSRDRKSLERISSAPNASSETTIGELHKEMAGIQLDLVDMAEEYGKLNLNFKNLVGQNKVYGAWDAIKIALYKTVGKKNKAKEIKLEAIQERGDALEILVNKMSEILNEQHEKAKTGKVQAKDLQIDNVKHMRYLDKKLIEELRGGQYTGTDLSDAENELHNIREELAEIDGVLAEYESNILEARTKGEFEKVQTLTQEVGDMLDIKYGILDGQLSAEGTVSEIRRELLDHAEGVQSAKGAIAASRVNYQAINALIDSMNELEIKYRHARSDMIPVFKTQAKVAGMGIHALDMKKTLTDVALQSQKLMDMNAKLVMHLAKETFDLLQTPLYDREKAREVEERISDYMFELNEQKKEWAEMQQSLSETTTDPHYARHQ